MPYALPLLLGAAALCGLASLGTAQEHDPAPFERYLAAQAAANGFSGSVLVTHEGATLVRGGFGRADREHGVANRPETKHRIGSITKPFAAAAILLLEQQGLLAASDPITRYVDGLPQAYDGITLAHLATHTSGIPNLEGLDSFREVRTLPGRPLDTLRTFVDEPLQFRPGERWSYSSSGYVLLAAVIEAVSGRSWEEFLREELLEPLQLSATGHDHPSAVLPHRARGYGAFRGRTVNAQFVHMDRPIGGGDLYSTVDDLRRFVEGVLSGELLGSAAGDRMRSVTPIRDPVTKRMMERNSGLRFGPGYGYGFGWFFGQRLGRDCLQHGGAIPGFTADLCHFEAEDLTVVVLCNTERARLTLQVATDLAAIALGESYRTPVIRKEVQLDEATRRRYVGNYRFSARAALKITIDGERLSVQLPGEDPRPLLAEAEGRFFLVDRDTQIEFEAGGDGAADSLVLIRGERRIAARRESK